MSIKLGVRDQKAGIVEKDIEEGLHSAAARALDVRPEQHVGLPDLNAPFRFEFLVRGRSQQLAPGEAAV